MKLSVRTIVFACALLAIVAGLIWVIAILIPPGGKDTPVVIMGGCIHAKAPSSDKAGWTYLKRYSSYTAAAKAVSTGDPYGIDWITLSSFDNNNPPNSSTGPRTPIANADVSITGTKGWAITYSGENGDGSEKPNALHVCSDASCNAAALNLDGNNNTARCTAAFNPNGPVYLLSDNHSRWEEAMNGSKIRELHYHDSDKACDGSDDTVESRCDTIYKILVETCSQNPATYTCSAADGHCNVTIGQ
jgi:hypothetical protein